MSKISEKKLAYIKSWRARNKDKVAVYEAKCDASLKLSPERLAKKKATDRAYVLRTRERINARARAYSRTHPDRVARRGKSHRLKKKFGITIHDYEAMLAAQMGKCALCGRTLDGSKQIDVDHCHATGKVRGILHSRCNRLIACAEDSIPKLKRAIAYLQAHSPRAQREEAPLPLFDGALA